MDDDDADVEVSLVPRDGVEMEGAGLNLSIRRDGGRRSWK